MRKQFVNLLLSTMILSGVSLTSCANQKDVPIASSIEKFIPNELMLENCLDTEIIQKVSQIDLLFKQVTGPAPIKQALLTNKLTESQVNLLISKSKKSDLCAANANLALSIYDTALDIAGQKNEKKSNISSKYLDNALSIYRNYASQGSVGSIKLLCVPDDGWMVKAVDAPSKKVCLNALYSKEITLSELERTKIFTAVYNAYWLNLHKNLSKRAEICYDFANETNIMNYSNSMLNQHNKDMCNVEFIKYGEKLFSDQNYQVSFKYLSVFDQSLNTTGIPQFELGYMYHVGNGVPQNYELALNWYKKAHEQGNNPQAQYNLGMMYMNGQGVLQNYIVAHAFFNLSSANGVEEAARVRDTLAKRMTNVQIEKAQNLAKEWIKR